MFETNYICDLFYKVFSDTRSEDFSVTGDVHDGVLEIRHTPSRRLLRIVLIGETYLYQTMNANLQHVSDLSLLEDAYVEGYGTLGFKVFIANERHPYAEEFEDMLYNQIIVVTRAGVEGESELRTEWSVVASADYGPEYCWALYDKEGQRIDMGKRAYKA